MITASVRMLLLAALLLGVGAELTLVHAAPGESRSNDADPRTGGRAVEAEVRFPQALPPRELRSELRRIGLLRLKTLAGRMLVAGRRSLSGLT